MSSSNKRLIKQVSRLFAVSCFIYDLNIKCDRTCRVKASAKIGNEII